MASNVLSWVVSLDGGTTNTRARLLHDGTVVATARRAVGVRDEVLSGDERPLSAAVRAVIREVLKAGGVSAPDAIIAGGMLTADVGLVLVPHVMAPAGLEELANAARLVSLHEVADHPILFIPGVRTPGTEGSDGWANADVMRGEECETLGALVRLGAHADLPTAFVWPGSHRKVVEVNAQGKITRSTTSLAGEMTSALARHTLLAASLPTSLPDEPDHETCRAGLRLGAREGLGRAAFLVRVSALTETFDSNQRGSFWVGAIVGDDARHMIRHPILESVRSVWVGGREPLRSLYGEALREHLKIPVKLIPDAICEEAAAIGSVAIAQRRSQLDRRSG